MQNGMTRRGFAKLCTSALVAIASYLSGCAGTLRPRPVISCDATEDGAEFDYIVVGSGAGGGPLAANLALKGHRVLLIEAGGDEENDHYRIPLFHPMASEDPALRWDFFVRHYTDESASRKDCKFSEKEQGVFYPRCSTLGGCTAHNAMILVYPHNSDWDFIAQLTGDPSWSSENMRQYFERMENCQYEDPEAHAGRNRGRHGFSGWLPTSQPSLDTVLAVFRDRQLRKTILHAALVALRQHLGKPMLLLKTGFDPNDWRNILRSNEGMVNVPLTTYAGKRFGSREYIREVEKSCAGRLRLRLNTLVTRVLLDEDKRAVAVECLQGKRLYRADRDVRDSTHEGQKLILHAKREIILSGGAFNTPQLLMLSGIGPQEHLLQHGIPARVDLPGVGENLQDRYEVSIITEMKKEFSLLRGMSLELPKPGEIPNEFYRQWQNGEGIYTTNGAVLSMIKRSSKGESEPDLFIFGMPGYFKGYYPGYSKRVAADQKHFTWAILKAHTQNTAGVVRLKSRDPMERPYINFRYFDEGNDTEGRDIQALVEGMQFVRRIIKSLKRYIRKEVIPGKAIDTDAELTAFAKSNAWGHHASCSCKMGPASDPFAVVDHRFRVHGVKGLRVVDASVFPRIPGFFIVSAVYMISEKASDVIHEDAIGETSAQPRESPV